MRRSFSILMIWVLSATLAWAAGDPQAGKEKAQACASCHGTDGNSENPAFPNLAGQYETYLLYALREYKNGGRDNPVMVGIAEPLADQDMQDLAAFFARQDGGLQVLP